MFAQFLFSYSCQSRIDLFDAPTTEEKIQALFDRLNKTIGKVSPQEVLPSPQTHGHVLQALSQRGGRHSLGKWALRVHCSTN